MRRERCFAWGRLSSSSIQRKRVRPAHSLNADGYRRPKWMRFIRTRRHGWQNMFFLTFRRSSARESRELDSGILLTRVRCGTKAKTGSIKGQSRKRSVAETIKKKVTRVQVVANNL